MVWSDGIKRIKFANNLNGSPAAVHRASGVIYLDKKIWNDLEKFYPDYHKDIKYFILLHEYAHVVLQSRNEHDVDNYAFSIYKQDPKRSYKAAVLALTTLLRKNSPSHMLRMRQQFQRAWNTDKTKTKNPNLKFFL